MTTLTLPTGRTPGTVLRNLMTMIDTFVAGARDGQAMARRYEILSRLSDRQLAAQGISREDIPQIAARTAA